MDTQDITDRFNPETPELLELAQHPVVGHNIEGTVYWCWRCLFVGTDAEPCACTDPGPYAERLAR